MATTHAAYLADHCSGGATIRAEHFIQTAFPNVIWVGMPKRCRMLPKRRHEWQRVVELLTYQSMMLRNSSLIHAGMQAGRYRLEPASCSPLFRISSFHLRRPQWLFINIIKRIVQREANASIQPNWVVSSIPRDCVGLESFPPQLRAAHQDMRADLGWCSGFHVA